jgi:hypothetical protein
VAGGVGASGDGQELDFLRNKSKENVRGGSRREGEEIGERRRRGVHRRCRNRPGSLQTCGSPSTNFVVFVWSRAERRKGGNRGECGLLIGVARGRNGQVLIEN